METVERNIVRPAASHRKRLAVASACVVAIVVAVVGIFIWRAHRVPSPDADMGRLSRYMASPAFAALPDSQKTPYLDAFQRAGDRGQLTPDQQQGVVSNLMKHDGKSPIQEYFSLPPGKERQKFLDNVIDQQLKMQQQGNLPPPPDGGGPKVVRVQGKAPIDSIPPEERAQMDQFMQDLHDRRVARGLSDNGTVLFTRTH